MSRVRVPAPRPPPRPSTTAARTGRGVLTVLLFSPCPSRLPLALASPHLAPRRIHPRELHGTPLPACLHPQALRAGRRNFAVRFTKIRIDAVALWRPVLRAASPQRSARQPRATAGSRKAIRPRPDVDATHRARASHSHSSFYSREFRQNRLAAPRGKIYPAKSLPNLSAREINKRGRGFALISRSPRPRVLRFTFKLDRKYESLNRSRSRNRLV